MQVDTTPDNESDTQALTRIDALPTEIKDMIIGYTDQDTLIAITRCSKELHAIGSRILYGMVSVTGLQARKLFLSVITPSWTSNICSGFIRSLTFSVIHYHDIWLSYPLFVEALTRMHNLSHLSVIVEQSPGARHLIGHLTTHEIIRPFAGLFQQLAYNIRRFSKLTVPRLNSLKIQGDVQLSRIARCRPLTSLILVDHMQISDLHEVFLNIQHGGIDNGRHMRHFEVNLDIWQPSDIISSLIGISNYLPNLISLTIRTSLVNPLMIGELMSCRLKLFPKLQTLSVNATNEKNIVHPVGFISSKPQCMAAEELLLEKMGEMRASLERVTYGLHKWTRVVHIWPPKWQIHIARVWEDAHFFGISQAVGISYKLGNNNVVIPWTVYINMKEEATSYEGTP